MTRAFFGSTRMRTSAVAVQVGHGPDDRQAAHELGDQPELQQVLGQHLGQQVAFAALLGPADVGPEADALPAQRGCR